MELFTLDSSLEKNDLQLLLTSELLTYWIHFSSFQMHWRGYELAENQHLEDWEKQEMTDSYSFFDQLYHRFLIYLPRVQDDLSPIYFSIPIDAVMVIYEELDDYIQYCHVYDEHELMEISKQYKLSFQSLLDERDHLYH